MKHPLTLALPLLLAALLPGIPALAQTAPPADRLALVTEHSTLDHGLGDWRETSLVAGRWWNRRHGVEATLTQTRRFGLTDSQASLAYTAPLSPTLTATGQVSVSPSHNVLARHSVAGQLQYEFSPAWLLHAGLKHSRYDNTDATQGTLGLERYVGDFSTLLAWHPTRASGTGASGFEWRGYFHYRDTSHVGLIASTGREAMDQAPGVVVVDDVRSLALVGRHALSASWTVNYALGRTRQGRFYTRNTASLGAQYTF